MIIICSVIHVISLNVLVNSQQLSLINMTR